MNKKTKKAGMNGFGRFGLHLLKYWLDRAEESVFYLSYINDEMIPIEKAYQKIISDKAVQFNKYKVSISGNDLVFLTADGLKYSIEYSNHTKNNIPWNGKPDIFLECSGRYTLKKDCEEYLVDSTKLVIISATAWDAEKTLVYGFNHKDYNPKLKIISYGSCTVNAYVPLAKFIEDTYGVVDSDVNVIHNIQDYRLPDFYSLNRKFCTLEKSGPNLLGFLDKNNFIVNYTVIPYSGISIIDMRFRLKKYPSQSDILKKLDHAFSEGVLKGLYNFEEKDIGPEVHNCTTFSTVFVKDNVRMVGNSLYLFGYFDNENSVNRYFDLVEYIANYDKK